MLNNLFIYFIYLNFASSHNKVSKTLSATTE